MLLMVLIAGLNEIQKQATAQLIDGKAYIYRSYGIRLRMKKNREYRINEGDMIKTYRRSKVRVELPDGAAFTLEENSAWQFASIKFKFHTLSAGVAKILKTGNKIYTLTTPVVAAGVRGTQFTVAVSPEGSTYVSVGEGEVELKNPLGLNQTLQAGQKVEVTTEKPTQAEPSEIENPLEFYGKYSSLIKENPSLVLQRINSLLDELESTAEKSMENTTEMEKVYPFLKSATVSYSELLSSKIGRYLKLEREQYARLLKKMQEIKMRQKLIEKSIEERMKQKTEEYQEREKKIMEEYR